MFPQKLDALFIFLMIFTVSAQDNFATNIDLSQLSQTFLFSDFETATDAYDLSPSDEAPVKFHVRGVSRFC